MMEIELQSATPLIEVFDMPSSLGFYRDTLGFRVITDSGRGDDSGWVMLKLGGATIMLNTAYDDGERPTAPDPARTAAHRDTCIYFGCPDVDGAFSLLLARGIRATAPKVAPYGMEQLYLTDPDGYGLCFQWPSGSTQPEGV